MEKCVLVVPQDEMLVCGSIGSGQLALFPQQMDQVKQLEILDPQTGGLFDYIPIRLEKLLISYDDGEQVVDVVVGTTFTLYLTSYSRVYYCGKNSLFDDTCSKVVNSDVPNFRWVFFFDPIPLSELEQHVHGGGITTGGGLVFVQHITCGAKHCAFLLSNSSVYVAGSNEMGQIGMGKSHPVISCPKKLELGIPQPPERTFLSSSSTEDDDDDESSDEMDEVEDDELIVQMKKKRKLSSQKVISTTRVTKIKCSYDNTVLQTADGFVYASGDNEYQQISNSKEEGKVFEFKRLFFKELSLDQYKNIKEIIVMDSFMLSLTNEGKLYISEGNYTFEKMGLDIDYFNTTDFPQNSITQIFKTSYAFFVRTRCGEIFYLQQGLAKMVKSILLSYNDFIIGSGRYHVVSISTNLHNEGLYEAIGYNKFGNLGFRSEEETVKAPKPIPKVTDWIRSKSLHSCCYKIAADFFNTIVYRVRDLGMESIQRQHNNLLSMSCKKQYSDCAIMARFDSFEQVVVGEDSPQEHVEKQTKEKKGTFDEGTSTEQLNHIMNLLGTGGNVAASKK